MSIEELALDSQGKLGKVNSRREARAVIDRWNVITALEETDKTLKADPFGLTPRDLYEFKEAYMMISDMNNGEMNRFIYTICFQSVFQTNSSLFQGSSGRSVSSCWVNNATR